VTKCEINLGINKIKLSLQYKLQDKVEGKTCIITLINKWCRALQTYNPTWEVLTIDLGRFGWWDVLTHGDVLTNNTGTFDINRLGHFDKWDVLTSYHCEYVTYHNDLEVVIKINVKLNKSLIIIKTKL